MTIDTSIIISTYNSPEWLEKVLCGYNNQTYRQFEIVIADDGSKQDTFNIIKKLQAEVFYKIVHIWQEDNGFQKTKILNKAIVNCTTPYIVMSDGDCIPRSDFVEQHVKYRQEGCFLSGGYFKLPIDISKRITKEDIYTNTCFDLSWLKEKGLKSSFKNNKLSSKGFKAWLLNKVTPTKATWNGHNSSGWKADILAVNGFDERMQYGGEDRELGERMMNSGIKPIQLRYTAICLHLDHSRGYIDAEALEKNKLIRKTTDKEHKKWTDFGIVYVD
ncbi:MAG: glycosyltransferase family 2 protein [Aquaticitalea sp.]